MTDRGSSDIEEILMTISLLLMPEDDDPNFDEVFRLRDAVVRKAEQAIQKLIAQEADRARLDELIETRSFGNPHDYIEARIATLTASKGGGK